MALPAENLARRVTTKVAAEMLGVGQMLILQQIRRGKLPAIKDGFHSNSPWLISTDAIEHYRATRLVVRTIACRRCSRNFVRRTQNARFCGDECRLQFNVEKRSQARRERLEKKQICTG